MHAQFICSVHKVPQRPNGIFHRHQLHKCKIKELMHRCIPSSPYSSSQKRAMVVSPQLPWKRSKSHSISFYQRVSTRAKPHHEVDCRTVESRLHDSRKEVAFEGRPDAGALVLGKLDVLWAPSSAQAFHASQRKLQRGASPDNVGDGLSGKATRCCCCCCYPRDKITFGKGLMNLL